MRRLSSAALLLALATAASAQVQPLVPPSAEEIATRFLGPARQYADGDHVIVLTPRAAPGAATPLGTALAARHGAELTASWPIVALAETCYVLRLPEGADAAAVAEAVEAEDGVLLAYPIQSFATQEGPGPFGAEPLRASQAALGAMRVGDAHAHATGAGIRVALIDTAVAADHPDLAAQIAEAHDFVGDGASAERHGTAMAALIAADARNGLGMVGVAPDARLLALRGCWEEEPGVGRCNTFSLALALDRAVQSGARVLNLSLGGPSDRLLEALVGQAIERGALVVAAEGGGPFPSAVPGVLTAADAADAALRAPGVDVLGAEPGGGYDFFSGASVAAAHASGVAALVWSGAPGAEAEAVAAALAAGGAPLDACASLARVAACR